MAVLRYVCKWCEHGLKLLPSNVWNFSNSERLCDLARSTALSNKRSPAISSVSEIKTVFINDLKKSTCSDIWESKTGFNDLALCSWVKLSVTKCCGNFVFVFWYFGTEWNSRPLQILQINGVVEVIIFLLVSITWYCFIGLVVGTEGKTLVCFS